MFAKESRVWTWWPMIYSVRLNPNASGNATLSTGGGGVQVQDFGAKPTLVSLYAKTAAAAFEPAFKTTGEVSYETSLAQVP